MPHEVFGLDYQERPAVVVIDGYEQLSRWSRFRLKRFCRRHRLGLLVTAHASVGLPPLYRTDTDRRRVEQLVDQLQQGSPGHITPEDIAERLDRFGPDVRELLFDLYDLYEQRQRNRS